MATRRKRSIEPHDVDMPELFRDLIRERSLYAVLNSLAQACRSRADHFRQQSEIGPPPTVRPLLEDEVEFFDDASEWIGKIPGVLDVEWRDRAPMCADHDFQRSRERQRQVARDYFRSLAAALNDPSASEEERRRAGDSLAKEGEGTMWFDRETGQPDFEVAEMFRGITAALSSPDTPEDEKRQMALAVDEFVNR